MADEAILETTQARLAVPYVGLRPFEREEHALFRGRDRDARFLCDKIFAARLTLFYAPSGLGKSSLLRTLVIPALEDQHSLVVYHDAWTSEQPLDALKSALVAQASALGVTDAGIGAPTLGELVALIRSVDERTVVLIFDQFEEFLITHAQRLDQLRHELGALVRASGPDVRVVIALRQEYLAALEPFRQDILNLFQSTYQLEALDAMALREAVQYPASVFGVEWDPHLVERLLSDLAKGMDGGAGAAGAVELPLLQVACEQIWAARGDELRITPALYERIGGKEHGGNAARAILDAYVRSVMPSRERDQVFTATLMRFLAPPSGMKMSFSAGDLAAVSGLAVDPVRVELERLGTRRVLRVRQYRSGTRYELLHDAFVGIVGPWRDAVLERAARQRASASRRRWVLFGLVLGVAASLLWWTIDQAQLKHNTTGRFAELRGRQVAALDAEREATFDAVAAYLLGERTGESRLKLLGSLLRENADMLPFGYGIDRSGVEFIALEEWDESWPLTFRYSTARKLDWYYFTHTWQMMSKNFAEKWGILVPTQLRLEPVPEFPRSHVELRGPGVEPMTLDLPRHEDSAFLSANLLPDGAARFLETLSEREPITRAERGGPWWVVPRWSLPAFKGAAGRLATDGSGLPAFLLALELQKDPGPLFSQPAVDLLLERVAQKYPTAVAEARAARGDRLRKDLAEVVRHGNALTSLQMVLETAAIHPHLESGSLAEIIEKDLTAQAPALPDRLHGPWRNSGAAPPAKARQDQGGPRHAQALKQAERWLPPVEFPIRCFVGSELERTWFAGNKVRPELLLKIERVRDDLYRRFGVAMPGVRFHPDDTLPPRAFRFVVLNQGTTNEDTKPIEPGTADPLDRWSDELWRRAEVLRVYWWDADDVARLLTQLDPPLREWLKAHYSTTDLKVLLRAVIQPDLGETAEPRRPGGDVAPPWNTTAHPAWLLASLVFWSQVEGDHVEALTRRLRETQRARLEEVPLPRGGAADGKVAEGIAALVASQPEQAYSLFAGVLRADRDGAVASFLSRYPRPLSRLLQARVDKRCAAPTRTAWLDREERIAVEGILESRGRSLPAEEDRRLRMCMLSAPMPADVASDTQRISEALAARHPPGEWPPAEAAWFGKKVLESMDPLQPDPDAIARARPYLRSAFLRLELVEAEKLIDGVARMCDAKGPRNWCWSLVGELVAARPQGRVPLLVAWYRRTAETEAIVHEVLTYADLAERNLADALPEQRRAMAEDIALIRATANARLAALGEETRWVEAERLARPLLKSTAIGDLALIQLVQVLRQQDRVEEANELLDDFGRLKQRVGANELNQRLFNQLARGDTESAATISAEAYKQADQASPSDRPGYLYVAAIGQLLTRTGNWELTARTFIKTDHEYRNYVAMMLYARMAGEARQEALEVLERAWAEADQTTWSVRMRGGDPTPWREMLIGYYLGKLNRQAVFGKLLDDAAFNSSDFRFIDLPRRGMLCEAQFYEALLAQAQGDLAGMRKGLENVIATNHRAYFEHPMARFLLRHLN